MRIKIYGCRGSIGICRPGSRYGGNSSCMTVSTGDEYIVLDAGTGLMALRDELRDKPPAPVNIFISHLHLDHISGLGTFDPVWNKDAGVRIYTCARENIPFDEQLCRIFAPPYWPVSLKEKGAVEFFQVKNDEPIQVGSFTVTAFNAIHPDSTISFHVTDGKKSLVHLLDNETSDSHHEVYNVMKKYCTNADAVVFDSAYSHEDYLTRFRGWGHSTVKNGVKYARDWNCKMTIFAHYDQKYSDNDLDAWKEHFDGDGYMLSYDGLEMDL